MLHPLLARFRTAAWLIVVPGPKRMVLIDAQGIFTFLFSRQAATAFASCSIIDFSTYKKLIPENITRFIVEEAIQSGIEDIIIVTGKAKRPIEDHFDANVELEQSLASQG